MELWTSISRRSSFQFFGKSSSPGQLNMWLKNLVLHHFFFWRYIKGKLLKRDKFLPTEQA
jgi:hypothetical protein